MFKIKQATGAVAEFIGQGKFLNPAANALQNVNIFNCFTCAILAHTETTHSCLSFSELCRLYGTNLRFIPGVALPVTSSLIAAIQMLNECTELLPMNLSFENLYFYFC